MCRRVRRIAFYLAIALVVFLGVSLWSGGDKFRWLGEKTIGVIIRGSEKLGEKADAVKAEKDKTVARMKKLAGGRQEESEEDLGASRKNTEDVESGKRESDDDKIAGDKLQDLLHRMWKKVKKIITN